MMGRRGWGEDSIYFDHSRECRDPETHRHCMGRWRGVVSLKPGPDGQRLEPPGRRPNRRGACTAVGSRRPGGQPGRRPACTSPCRRVALRTCPRRHQDEEVPALFGTAQDGVEVLREHLQRQAAARQRAGVLWQDNGLVFTTALGTQLDAADVRRSLRTICRRADLGDEWTPRELRHTFVSLLSDNGMAIEEISRLVGHSSSNVTETVYRRQIRPVITVGAEAMDKIFANEQ